MADGWLRLLVVVVTIAGIRNNGGKAGTTLTLPLLPAPRPLMTMRTAAPHSCCPSQGKWVTGSWLVGDLSLEATVAATAAAPPGRVPIFINRYRPRAT